jgi:hypothetical protein
MMRKTTSIKHGVTSTGQQRAIDLAAFIAREKAARIKAGLAPGATNIEIVAGAPGCLVVVEWS